MERPVNNKGVAGIDLASYSPSCQCVTHYTLTAPPILSVYLLLHFFIMDKSQLMQAETNEIFSFKSQRLRKTSEE